MWQLTTLVVVKMMIVEEYLQIVSAMNFAAL